MKRIELDCQPAPASVRSARQFVKDALVDWELTHLVEVAELLTSEVVTNALVHARSRFVVAVEFDAPTIRVEVTDFSPSWLPGAGRNASLESEGGRGLFLVRSLANGWGYRSAADRKAVWFELTGLPGAAPAPEATTG